ncbi:MAG TPA: metallopeptidase family protein [Ktedonobacteraceae bacterium]
MDNQEQIYSADDDRREASHDHEAKHSSHEQARDLEQDSQEQAEGAGKNEQAYEPAESLDEYDYNREPPLDSATANSNRGRSKYVFMTLCFLIALIFLYTYITNANSGNTTDWFPLIGALVLGVMGVVFLRSSDSPSATDSVSKDVLATTRDTAARTLSPFEELVQAALTAIPAEFHEQMENVTVHVEYEPDAETLARTGVNEGHTLLGLYEGVPLTSYGRAHAPYPEVITIYQRPIEDYCRHNPTRIREQVRTTVLHEVAHHFGMGHEEMPIWVK